jgi:NAD(P)H dehydrogenase (quinone)
VKHLIIYANHSHSSFNHAILKELEDKLAQQGLEFILRDLYKMEFQPVLTNSEMKDLRSGLIMPDVAVEQDYIRWADVIHFIYPIWWTGMPAILKGYIDRVFAYGFAYLSGKEGPIGLLQGKKVLIYNTLGQSREDYEKEMFHALNLTSDTGIFAFCGMKVVEHLYFPSIMRVTDDERKNYLLEVENATKKLISPSIKNKSAYER